MSGSGGGNVALNRSDKISTPTSAMPPISLEEDSMQPMSVLSLKHENKCKTKPNNVGAGQRSAMKVRD
tara:strand:- start:35570 stop:35773 length:204 start_codon:yes stop_codon:yes gene_type:complete